MKAIINILITGALLIGGAFCSMPSYAMQEYSLADIATTLRGNYKILTHYQTSKNLGFPEDAATLRWCENMVEKFSHKKCTEVEQEWNAFYTTWSRNPAAGHALVLERMNILRTGLYPFPQWLEKMDNAIIKKLPDSDLVQKCRKMIDKDVRMLLEACDLLCSALRRHLSGTVYGNCIISIVEINKQLNELKNNYTIKGMHELALYADRVTVPLRWTPKITIGILCCGVLAGASVLGYIIYKRIKKK